MKKKIASILLATTLAFPTFVLAEDNQTIVNDDTPVVETSVEAEGQATEEVTVTEETVTEETVTEETATEETATEETATEETATEETATEETATEETATEEATTEETTTEEVEAGLTPESPFYFLDTMLENVQLVFTFDSEAKVQLYAEISSERLAELKAIEEENRGEFVNELLAAYEQALASANEELESATADGEDVTEAVEAVDEAATDGIVTVEELEVELEEEQANQLEDTLTTTIITAASVKDIDPEVVKTLKDQGVGYGKIALTVSISNLSGKSVEEVTEMLATTGVGNVAKQLGLHPGNLKKRGLKVEAEVEETDVEATEEVAVETEGTEEEAVETETETTEETATEEVTSEETTTEESVQADADQVTTVEKNKGLENQKKVEEKRAEIAKKVEEKKAEIAKKVAEKKSESKGNEKKAR